MTKVAINGFGRIGRLVARAILERPGCGLELVSVNDLADAKANAWLLKHDSVHGKFPGDVVVDGNDIIVDGKRIHVTAERDPAKLPHKANGVDIALECTGFFTDRAGGDKHIEAGAKRVLFSAPAKGVDLTVVYGVNDDKLTADMKIVSNASCTTNCLAPIAKVLHETVGIRHGVMTTIHAYTADQNLLDGPHKDLRRARAAALNLVPTSTGAAQALGLVIPELAGRLQGYAVRVPTPTGSIVDLTVEVERPTSLAEINGSFAGSADYGALAGILAYSEEPLVSADIVKSPYSAIFDAPLTAVVDETQVKVVAWYDNEWGYANRLVDLATRVMAGVPAAA
jgi:glyceraldehyde 3-phosphate dehydrogenase